MRGKAKTAGNALGGIWIHGQYVKNPSARPSGEARPEGHYIDSGSWPGTRVSAIDMNTFCMFADKRDRKGKCIYDNDILLYETAETIGYYAVFGTQAVEVTGGEILALKDFPYKDIKVIGNLLETPDFVEGMRHYEETGRPLPYIPNLNAQEDGLPYLHLLCETCRKKTYGCRYVAKCGDCGSFLVFSFATEVKRERKKVLA